MNEIELKPCPFCGCEGSIVCGSSYEFGFPAYSVECKKCGSIGRVRGSEQEAIEAWNTRAERTCTIEGKSPLDYCSSCGELANDEVNGWYGINYCPFCGSKVVK